MLFAFRPFVYAESIDRYCRIYKTDRSLVYSIIKAESGFDNGKVSPKGAVGLMQIMPDTAEYVAGSLLGIEDYDIYDPDDNLRLGIRYIAYLKEKFDDDKCVVCAYNAGEGNVVKWLSDERYSSDGKTLLGIPFGETDAYCRKVGFYSAAYRLIFVFDR